MKCSFLVTNRGIYKYMVPDKLSSQLRVSAKDIYCALIGKNWKEVINKCNKHRDGPFVNISRNRDSVLQKALYAGEADLVMNLLEDADGRFERRELIDKLLGDVNSTNATPLHVAATQDICVEAAVKICEYADGLLFAQNNKGEFPIFAAVRYGQVEMFKFLHSKYIHYVRDEEIRNTFYYKVSNEHETYTLLHVAIFNEHFELALHIVRTIPGLISEKDHQQMTGLHMLAMNSSAFRFRYWKRLELLLPSPFRHISDTLRRRNSTDHQVKDATDHKGEDAGGTSNDIRPPQNATISNPIMQLVDEIMKLASSYTMKIPCWSKIKKEHRRRQAALKLGSILVMNDTEWIDELGDDDLEDSSSGSHRDNNADEEKSKPPPKPQQIPTPKYGENLNSDAEEESGDPPTPLILATKYGCVDIALEIIKEHPQTVEQVNRKYGSILHLAIKYRRIEIFDAVNKSKMQMRKLVRLEDKDENSILHMVALNRVKVKVKNGIEPEPVSTVKVKVKNGIEPEPVSTVKVKVKNGIEPELVSTVKVKVKNGIEPEPVSTVNTTDTPEHKPPPPWEAEEIFNDSRSPAFILQEDLLLFERVEKIIKTHFHTLPNKDLELPEQLFAAKKEQLREDAQEWMKRTAENCSIVAVLIATVAFAAAYTVPGGTDDKNGSPLLLKETFFVVFTIADVLSLASTLTAVVVFLSILCSSYRLQDFKATLPKSLMFGISCLIFSLTMMMFAFAATIILMIRNRQEWTKIALYAVAFLPVTVLVVTYLPFFGPLEETFKYIFQKAMSIVPRFTRLHKPGLSKIKKPATVLDPSIQV